jgi:squalene monooxygenase
MTQTTGPAEYDIAIVGAGVGGAALGAALAADGRRVLIVESDLRPPKKFVGELLQPGGVEALKRLGLLAALDGIDAQSVGGFAVVTPNKRHTLCYPMQPSAGSATCGFAFHHGRFVANLREEAGRQPSLTMVRGTVQSLIKEQNRVVGYCYRDHASNELQKVRAKLVVVADGRHSRLRSDLTGAEPKQLSYSVGVLLRGAKLPVEAHGNVILAKPAPILGYPIASGDIRLLIDVPGELPSRRDGSLGRYLVDFVAPQLPEQLQGALKEAVDDARFGVMPTYALSPVKCCVPGSVVFGDALNMRHPLTGSGMTVALNDAALLLSLLDGRNLEDPHVLDQQLKRFYRLRRPLSRTVDMLAGALYQLLSARDSGQARMRDAMLGYWQLGGAAVNGPMRLLSGLDPRPSLLVAHYLAVASLGVTQALTPRTSLRRPLDVRGAKQLLGSALSTLRNQLSR